MQFRFPKSLVLVLVITFGFRQSEVHHEPVSHDIRLLASVWYALSAENQACYLQTYQLAGYQLSKVLQGNKTKKKSAIVTDLDETLLDNSPWTLRVLLEGKDYPDYWNEWEKAGRAKAFPGAVDFFTQAHKKGAEIFYVSNRMHQNLDATIRNLQNLGLPNADSAHIFLKTIESNKVSRRKSISEKHEIVMLLGDNLADFDGVWEKAQLKDRTEAVANHKLDWGTRFIVFPNPVYGGWKDGIFNYQHKWKAYQSDSIWQNAIQTYLKENSF